MSKVEETNPTPDSSAEQLFIDGLQVPADVDPGFRQPVDTTNPGLRSKDTSPEAEIRYMQENGGGQATGATSEPPKIRRPDKRPLSKRAGMDRDAARAATIDDINEQLHGPQGPEDDTLGRDNSSSEDAAMTRRRFQTVVAIGDLSVAKEIAGSNTSHQMAILRARQERRQDTDSVPKS